MLNNIVIEDLVPSQIIELIKELKQTLEIVKYSKKTNSKVAAFKKNTLVCPRCNSLAIVKNGHTKTKVQTYKCNDCGKRFNDLTNTVFSGTHLNYEQIEIFIQCFNNKLSLRKTAKKMGTDKNTVFLLRHKLLDSLKKIRDNTILSDEVEADEFYRSINLKGTKPDKMPRFSKPRTSNNSSSTRGISSHKVCIASATDSNDNMFMEIVGTGPITSKMVEKSLTPKLKNIKKVITDCKSSYEKEAKDNHWNLIQVKSNCYVDENGNSLANVNSLQSGLSTFLSIFRGVSTKHLQGYLDWYIFDKYLNYSIEINNHEDIILTNLMNMSTNITATNMYNNSSGIDFEKVYADYNYDPLAHHA